MVAEIGLRIGNYGTDLSLFKTDLTGKYLYMNPQIGKRYFTNENNATHGNMDFFEKEKSSHTLRFFVLGSSTALGFPYMNNGTFPRILKYRIQRNFPGLKIEIINLSISAINTFALLDIAKELSKYEPDAVFIYAGQNEYHGTLGIASSSSFGNHPLLTHLFICVKHLRLVQLFNNTISGFRQNNASGNLNLTLMERLAAGQKIPYGSKKYQKGLDYFEDNLNKILRIFSSNGTPVYIGTLVTNQKGIHPFESNLKKSEIQHEWEKLFEAAKYSLAKGDTTRACSLFLAANHLDSTYAECHFQLGEIEYAWRNFDSAKKHYISAKELDQLRFRAPEAFNRIIKNVTKNNNRVVLVDVEKAFIDASPNQIVGEELLLEHVHPNLKGYFLMADTYFKALINSNLLPSEKYDTNIDDRIKDQIPLTKFDTVYGYISNILLKENWPFNEPLPAPTTDEQLFEGKVAGGLAVKQYSWKDAMEKLFNYYYSQNDLRNALAITEGLCLEFPHSIEYFERAAKLAQTINDDSRAWFYLLYIWNNFGGNTDVARQLVTTSLNLDQPQNSLPFIDYLIASFTPNQKQVELKKIIENIILHKEQLASNPEDVSLLISLSTLYLKLKNMKSSQKYLQKTLVLEPDNKTALELQSKIG